MSPGQCDKEVGRKWYRSEHNHMPVYKTVSLYNKKENLTFLQIDLEQCFNKKDQKIFFHVLNVLSSCLISSRMDYLAEILHKQVANYSQILASHEDQVAKGEQINELFYV